MPGAGCEEGAIRLLEVNNKFEGLVEVVKEENGKRCVTTDGMTEK